VIDMTFNIQDKIETLKNDLDKKYLSSGLRISGDVSGDKVNLYLIDDYGKHSAFMQEYFYGKLENKRLTGNFRISNYALILLIVLFVLALESVVSAIVLKRFDSIAVPAIIAAAEVLYWFWLRNHSKEYNNIICNYLNSLCDGEEVEN
jgi:hypothetical protein